MKNIMIANPFRVFKNVQYLLYWVLNTFSLMGSWVDFTLRQWVIVEMVKSERSAAAYVGLYNLVRFIPAVLFSFFAGYVSDRFNPKKVLVLITIIDFLNACVISFLVYTNNLNIFNFAVLGFILGLTGSFYFPVRSKFINLMVKETSDIPASFSWQGISFNLSRIIGPVIAGYVAKYWGIHFGFLINAFSYIPLIVYLFFFSGSLSDDKFKGILSKKEGVLQEIKNTFFYILKNSKLLKCFYNIFTINFLGVSLFSFLQIFVKEVLNGNIAYFSYLVSILGAGAVIGALLVASLNYQTILYFPQEIFLLFFGVAILIFSILPKYSFLLMFFIGIFQALTFGLTNNKVQLITDENILGKIMGIYSFFNISISYLGVFVISKIGYILGVLNLFKIVSLIIIFSAIYIGLKIKEG
ncbi:MAG: MFS transporter [bacterium]